MITGQTNDINGKGIWDKKREGDKCMKGIMERKNEGEK
jgi:hypothetical protein